MSFNNDDDGLAALFGGITPQAGADSAPGPRRAAPAPEPAAPQPSAAPQQPAAPQQSDAPPAPQYPGLAAQGYPAPDAPATPAYQMPAPAPSYQPPAPVPSYDLPVPAQPPAFDPVIPAPSYDSPASTRPPAYPAPDSPPPASPGYDLPAPAPAPGYPPPAPAYPAPGFPAPASPGYDLPRPDSAPGVSAPPTSGYPGLVPARPEAPAAPAWPASAHPDAPAYPGQHAAPPGYPAPQDSSPAGDSENAPPAPASPPTAQYPAGLDPAAFGAAQGVPGSPRADGPPAPANPAPPIVEPPAPQAFDGFASLGLADAASTPAAGGASPSLRGAAAPAGAAESTVHPEAPVDPRDVAREHAPDQTLLPAPAASLSTAFPPGPLLPSAIAAVETPEELERSTIGEKIGLPIAILGGPIGLVVAIVIAARGARRRGWLIGVARASLVLGVISTIGAGLAGYALWNMRLDQLAHDEISAASAEFCAAAEADPSLVTAPMLGWPSPGSTITDSLALMQTWTDNWTALAATSPADLRTGMQMLAARGQTIVDAVTVSRYVDDESNQAQIAALQEQSGVVSWYVNYCAQP